MAERAWNETRKMSEYSPATVSVLAVPGPWRGDPHLLPLAFPYPLGYTCPVSGDVEDRTGVAPLRYCEMHEIDRARESARSGSGDWARVAIYRYDPESTDYIHVEDVR